MIGNPATTLSPLPQSPFASRNGSDYQPRHDGVSVPVGGRVGLRSFGRGNGLICGPIDGVGKATDLTKARTQSHALH